MKDSGYIFWWVLFGLALQLKLKTAQHLDTTRLTPYPEAFIGSAQPSDIKATHCVILWRKLNDEGLNLLLVSLSTIPVYVSMVPCVCLLDYSQGHKLPDIHGGREGDSGMDLQRAVELEDGFSRFKLLIP